MPLYKYAKVLVQTTGIGSVLLGLVGLCLGFALISTWGRFSHRAPSGTSVSLSDQVPRSGSVVIAGSRSLPMDSKGNSGEIKDSPAILMASARLPRKTLPLNAVKQPADNPAEPERTDASLKPAVFEGRIVSERLGFLNDYAGLPANQAAREQRLRNLISAVVPYAPFHFGLDMPLPSILQGIFSHSQLPVEVREGRYLTISGERAPNARGRAFLWIDLQEGISVGGIFFYPSNGEPTPTLTLFSKQVKNSSLEMSQLPSAFVEDLTRWAAASGVPTVTTRYFINASSEKIVLIHDEDFCKTTATAAAQPEESCRQMKADAANLDLKAAQFLQQTQFASNATMRMTMDESPLLGHVNP